MRIDSREYDIQRLVLGVVLSFGIATFFAWPLAYLSAIAVCILLAARKPITVSMSMAVTAIVFVSVNIIYWIFSWLGNYPSVMVIALFIACYMTLYRAATGGSKIITLTLFLAVLVIPTSFNLAHDLAWIVVKWLPINTFLGFLIASICLLLMPLSPKIKQVDDSLNYTPAQAHTRALELSIAVMPVVVIFWLDASIDILQLLFLALFVHRLVECPSLRYKVTIGYFIANIAGGALAVIAFELLVVSPSFFMLMLLSLIVVSILSLRMFSDEKNTVLSFTSINAYIALMGATVMYNLSDAEIAYFTRLIQIALIALYLLVFFALYDVARGCLTRTSHANQN